MQLFDWIVLVLFIVFYGAWKTKEVKCRRLYSWGNETPWYTVGLSVMAAQASAITFLSTPGQAYHDEWVLCSFTLAPIAMVVICFYPHLS
jgi:Na+/proline symporter